MAMTLTGFVYDNAGNAISGATVQGYVSADDQTSGTTAEDSVTTDSNGKWSITTSNAARIPMDVKITYGSNVRWIKAGDKVNITDMTVTGTLTVGEDGGGFDFQLYSDRTGDGILWDADAEVLQLTGADNSTVLDVLDGDVRIVDKLYFYDRDGEYLSSDGSTLTITGATTLSGNVTVTGTIGSGNITSTGTVQGTVVTATTGFAPDASDGAYLGTSSLQFSDLFLADGGVINLGDDQDVTLTHVADTGILLNSSRQLQFGDSGTYIHQSADGVLDLVSDTEIEINATTIDINGAVDISGNATVGGNLTVNGTTTTVDTTNTVVKDSLIELNTGASSNSNDLGVVMERGSTGDNAIIAWDESADGFVVGTTTATGASTGNLTITAAPLVASDITAASLDISGNTDVDGTLEADAYTVDGTALNEYIADTVGAMFTGNTETRISATYQDADNTIDLVVDDMSSDSDTTYSAGSLLDLSGTTFNVDLTEAAEAAIADGDYILFLDGGATGTQSKEAVHDLATLFAGAGMTATSSVVNVIGGDGITANANDVAITAAQTTITSVYNSSLVVGYGASHANIDFATDNQIIFDIDGTAQVEILDGILQPVTDVDINLGAADKRFQTLYGQQYHMDASDDGIAEHSYAGMSATIRVGDGANVGAFDLVCISDVTNEVQVADADAIATSRVIGINPSNSAISDNSEGTILLHGFVRDDSWNWTTGATLYLGTGGTGSTITATAPSGTNDCVVPIGIALEPDMIYFNPTQTIIEHA